MYPGCFSCFLLLHSSIYNGPPAETTQTCGAPRGSERALRGAVTAQCAGKHGLLTQKMKLKKKSMYLMHLVQPSTPMVLRRVGSVCVGVFFGGVGAHRTAAAAGQVSRRVTGWSSTGNPDFSSETEATPNSSLPRGRSQNPP